MRFAVALVIALFVFSAGYLLGAAHHHTWPDIGRVAASDRPCSKVGQPFTQSTTPLAYKPGDSARVETLLVRRDGRTATWLSLAAGEQDDEVDAEGHEYQLAWKDDTWQVVSCRGYLRRWPGF